MSRRRPGVAHVAALFTVVCAAGCSSRPSSWNVDVGATTSVGLASGVALVDDADHQVVVLAAATPTTPPDIGSTGVPIGHNIATTVASADGSTLFVLSMGDDPATPAAEPPSLTAIRIDPSTFAVTSQNYAMPAQAQPYKSLAVDPEGQWAVAYEPVGFVVNENDIVIFDLTGAHSKPVVFSLQSFGGFPQQLTFTPPLLVNLASGDRRLLIIRTQIDFSLLDLDHVFDNPPRPEITVPLTSSTSGQQVTPVAVAVDGFNSNSTSDAQFAVRASDSTEVFMFTFGPPGLGNDFTPVPNEMPVGGIPSDMAFVRDELGKVGLAVLVPSTSSAVLVEGSTTATVTLPSAYSNLSLVTTALAGASSAGSSDGDAGASNPTPSNGDVALLWNGGAESGVALWTVGEPYFSIDVTGVSAPIQTVLDVPDPNAAFKVLEPSDGSGFYVLDLASGRVRTLTTPIGTATLSISPDGQRIWAYAQGGTALTCTDVSDFSPIGVTTAAPIDSVYDIAGAGNTRVLVALDMQGTIGATVFDALRPTSPPRRVPALLLEAP